MPSSDLQSKRIILHIHTLRQQHTFIIRRVIRQTQYQRILTFPEHLCVEDELVRNVVALSLRSGRRRRRTGGSYAISFSAGLMYCIEDVWSVAGWECVLTG
jgi:hypothetical protein